MVLLVLDNVDDPEQLYFLIDHDLFGPGSRIIITTRDRQLLNNLATDTFKVEGLNFDEALQLFHFHAFKKSSLTRDHYLELSGRAVKCAAGHPLALKVLGSHFGNKNKEKWEMALNELKKATAAIEGICLDVSDIGDVHLSPYVFEKMDNLRLLWIFYSKITKKGKVCFDEDLQSLPGNLKYLCWDEYPFKSLPTDFTAENLVELCMPHSQLERLWSGVQCVVNLKKIDLSYSKRLIEVPDLSRARKLETIYLEECESLCQVPSYFENLDQLITLFLAGCSSLSEFPPVPKNIRCLVLCRTSIARVPPSIESLSYLETLCLRYCTLEGLPNISKPKRLKDFELEGTVIKPKRLKDIELEGTELEPERWEDIESEEEALFKEIELEGTELKPERWEDIESEQEALFKEIELEEKAQWKDIESKELEEGLLLIDEILRNPCPQARERY
ncbi:hypothetical protein UlMin_010720 [Ulmus minor]